MTLSVAIPLDVVLLHIAGEIATARRKLLKPGIKYERIITVKGDNLVVTWEERKPKLRLTPGGPG